jgi:hypothetical protein
MTEYFDSDLNKPVRKGMEAPSPWCGLMGTEPKRFRCTLLFFLFLPLILCLTGCNTTKRLAAVDLKEPGWKIQEGQAVWRMKKGKRDVAGEILVATRPDGRALVQFSKNPFPLVIAQTTGNKWEVVVPTQNKRYSGHGLPPKRLTWLYLPRVLAGEPPPKGWTWQTLPNTGWRLESPKESIEGYFTP